jgi:hypothetical protein
VLIIIRKFTHNPTLRLAISTETNMSRLHLQGSASLQVVPSALMPTPRMSASFEVHSNLVRDCQVKTQLCHAKRHHNFLTTGNKECSCGPVPNSSPISDHRYYHILMLLNPGDSLVCLTPLVVSSAWRQFTLFLDAKQASLPLGGGFPPHPPLPIGRYVKQIV